MPYRMKITDRSNETSRFSAPVDPVTPPSDAQLTALHDAVEGFVIGSVGDGILQTDIVKDAGTDAVPASAFAQRELRWLVSYVSSTNVAYTREIACPDASLLGSGTDQLDLTGTEAAAFVTAFEAVAKVKEGDDYNTVSVTSIKLVGRRA